MLCICLQMAFLFRSCQDSSFRDNKKLNRVHYEMSLTVILMLGEDHARILLQALESRGPVALAFIVAPRSRFSMFADFAFPEVYFLLLVLVKSYLCLKLV